jgi:hypothetical protein
VTGRLAAFARASWKALVVGWAAILLLIFIGAYVYEVSHDPAPYRRIVIQGVECTQTTAESSWTC